MKTVGDLIHSLSFEDVLVHLTQIAPDGTVLDGFRHAWNRLLQLQPKPADMTVHIGLNVPEVPDDHFIEVYGVRSGERYALEFTDWMEWLSMPIAVDPDCSGMAETEVLARCLYEMTTEGYDPDDIIAAAAALRQQVEDIETELCSKPTEH